MHTGNIAGQRALLESLKKTRPLKEALKCYVGQGDIDLIGWREREAIAYLRPLANADIVDVGCGIGRLTRKLVDQPIRSYLGTDVLPEVLAEAEAAAAGDPRFRFAIVEGIAIPAASASIDIVCGFSVITHLIDQEACKYFGETARVLRNGGKAIYTFFDFGDPGQQAIFAEHVKTYEKRIDMLKWFERSTLTFFARTYGLEVDEFVEPARRAPAQFVKAGMANRRDAPHSWSFSPSHSLLILRKPA